MSTRPVIGEPAPPIELVEAGGALWSLAAHRGAPVLVIFHRHIH